MKKKSGNWITTQYRWTKADEKTARKAGEIKLQCRVATKTEADTYIAVVSLPNAAVIQGWTPTHKGDDTYYFGHISLSRAAIEKVLPELQRWLKQQGKKKASR